MASRFILPFADIGKGITPSSGAKLFFFATGTSTPKDTFSDSAALTPNTNPVIADSNGVFSGIFITGTYKVTLQDKNGSQIWEADPVNEVALAQGGTPVKSIDILSDAIADTGLVDGDSLNIKERTTGNGGGAMWDVVLLAAATPNTYEVVQCVGVPNLVLVLRIQDKVNLRELGATDYPDDSTGAIDRGFVLQTNLSIPLYGKGIFRYTGTLILPERFNLQGAGSPKIATFPQIGGDKSLLRPGFKDQITGSAILFDGTGTLSTYSTNRSDSYSSFVPMARYDFHAPYKINGFAFIQDMDVLDSGGTLTTIANDNRATNYTAGFVTQSTLSSHFDFTLFGYWTVAGMLIHNQNGGNVDPDYNGFNNSLINGGLAVIGHDTAAGAASEGLTGNRFVETGIYGADHHNRPDGFYTVPVFYIDGFLLGTAAGVRGTNFSGCNLRGYANNAIVTDHCDDLGFVNCVTEFSTLAGVANADSEGKFVGTLNTKKFTAVSLAATGGIGMDTYVGDITGPLQVVGAGSFDNAIFGQSGVGVRLSGSSGDPRIQLTDNFSSTVGGWVMRKDSDGGDTLDLLFDNVLRGSFDKNGGLKNGMLGLARGSTTISSGAISLGSLNYFAVAGEGGLLDTLTTINGGKYDGEIVVLRASNSTFDVIISESGGNIRLAGGNFTLDNAQDRIMLMFDGINWIELSRSSNGE